ncbi:50S ribosomal protein L4 [Candidatus Fokinia solitaria]|uniref:Large ribosomal subunit protein uL4 n=1 Tax=Candidatus Fokinia solitaria TaxID=1802984 RepID=A0A2U8BSD2_9RICK|nr:50S ribosomal protein L4 [Candidatus Fokinia solitaria]AWD33223.1 50S ribosomal protein L4 [Candidatus Fokinia solitaria]
MKHQVLDFHSSSVSAEIELPNIFDVEIRPDIIHRVICWQLAKRRLGTHKVKGRSEIAKSTRKIHAQKGGGRARHGAASAPQFRGGGVTFGPVVRSHEYKLNKKVRTMGLHSALSMKLQESKILVVNDLSLPSSKTKELYGRISALLNDKKSTSKISCLMVDKECHTSLCLASANMHNIDVLPVKGLNVYDLIKHEFTIFSKSAIVSMAESIIA